MEDFLRNLFGDQITITFLGLIVGFCLVAYLPPYFSGKGGRKQI